MKTELILVAMVLFMSSCIEQTSQTETFEIETPRDGVFIHITGDHNNPHRVLMPLQMAAIMADDKDVLIYLDIDAVNLVTNYAEDIAFGHFTPLKESIQILLEMGVEIYACPGCMKIEGIEEDELMDGIKIAQKERFFDFTGGRIISLSY
jgi:predicted peroxiredoxin